MVKVVCKYCGTVKHRSPSDANLEDYSCGNPECKRKKRLEQVRTCAPVNKKPYNKIKLLASLYKEKHGLENDKLQDL